jgi:GTPase SAR1 family protein
MSRPSQPLRILLAVGLTLAVAALAATLLNAADAALSVWERLQRLPDWIGVLAWLALAALGALTGWAVWRLLHPRAARAPRAAPLDRPALEARIASSAAGESVAAAARDELETLDRRRAEGTVQVALFGEISAGKSSLLRALAPQAEPAIAASGGTTTSVTRHRGRLPDGRELELADVPGLFEPGGERHAAAARAEAARSHAVLYIADGDLTRSQEAELRALAGYGRPLLLLLNKVDRYRDEERTALLERLRDRTATLGAQVLAVRAGHREVVTREWPDGRRETIERDAPPDLAELPRALQRLAQAGPALLEPGREAALLAHVDAGLAAAERATRAARSEAAVAKYTRRAVVGALAAVAPGTDLIIQGALATALTRELCAIHGLAVRDVDLDGLIERAGGEVRTSTSITLAIAGNALKAFPGLGTLGGGLMHAVAYGLIFDSLGRALAQTLAGTAALDRDATLAAFRAGLQAPAAERLKAVAALALDAWREAGQASASNGAPPAPAAGHRPS